MAQPAPKIKSLFTPEQRRKIIEAMDIGDHEIMLLLSMQRKFRYGTLTIMVRHGHPVYTERIKETYDLEAAIRGGDLEDMVGDLTKAEK
jgi:hypothetical protein